MRDPSDVQSNQIMRYLMQVALLEVLRSHVRHMTVHYCAPH